ncbi:MAG: hypothetical protein ACI31G_04075 [Bacilli bacterium]
MKNALKSKKVYIIALILSLIGLLIPFGILFITLIPSLNTSPFSAYPYLLGAIMVVYFFIGFIWGDLKDASIRRKEKKWDDKLDDETKTMIWKRRLPFYLASIVLLIAFLIVDGFYFFTGSFPFL